MYLVKLFLYSVALKLSLGNEEVFLDIPLGTLKGLKKTTVFHEVPMYSFQGIPYVEPNIGINKFRLSKPVEPWTGVKDATKPGNECIAYHPMRKGITGDDDCLHLNIYTPDLNREAKRAVLFVIHGGGLNSGSSHDDMLGGDFLVERDVILVTFNFRFGILGFSNFGDASVPGNAGLKDQVMALRWVKDNIEYFSGCPKRVTIMGLGSGSAFAHYHMVSPMSRGLFSGVIMHSSSMFSSWASTYTPKEDVMLFANRFGIKATSTPEIVQQLAQIPTIELAKAAIELIRPLSFDFCNVRWNKPSVELDFGQEIFLPTDSFNLIKSGNLADVPVIIGVNRDQAGLFIPVVIPEFRTIGDQFEIYIPGNLNVTNPAQRKMMADAMKEFYFHDKIVNTDIEKDFLQLTSDVCMIYSTSLSAKIMNSRNSSPVYEFLFSYYSPFGFMKHFLHMDMGVVHGDDWGYLFYGNYYKNKPIPGSEYEQKVNEMVEMWTNFAKERNPSATMEYAKVEWKPMGDDENYLEIGTDLTMKTYILKERINFWTKQYKNVMDDFDKLFN